MMERRRKRGVHPETVMSEQEVVSETTKERMRRGSIITTEEV